MCLSDRVTSPIRSVEFLASGALPVARTSVLVWGIVLMLVFGSLGMLVFRPHAVGPPEPEPGEERCGAEFPPEDELAWQQPNLTDPHVLQVTERNHKFDLEPEQDYVIELPDHPVELEGGLVLDGGRNVVLVGGEIRVPSREESPEAWQRRGLYALDQSGTLHIEGIRIAGPGLAEGISLQQPAGATVQIQAVHVETVHGSQLTNHADVVQTWVGPYRLRIDRLTGSTNYQGFFLTPNQRSDVPVAEMDIRRSTITGEEGSRYLLWTEEESPWLETCEVTVVTTRDSHSVLWPSPSSWPGVTVTPNAPASPWGVTEPGIGYESPE